MFICGFPFGCGSAGPACCRGCSAAGSAAGSDCDCSAGPACFHDSAYCSNLLSWLGTGVLWPEQEKTIRGFSKKARLTRRQRKNNFKVYLNDGLTKDVAEKYNPTSSKMKIIKKIFAGEHTVLYACLCRAVSFAQNKLGTVYNRILKK